MAVSFLDDYARIRLYTPDNVSVTVNQITTSGTTSEAVTTAKRLHGDDLIRTFGAATITGDTVGYVIWKTDLSTITEITVNDEIVDGSETWVVREVREGHFEGASRQFILRCVLKVS